MNSIKEKLTKNQILFEENVSLKNKTWIKTGGIVSLWITPISLDSLKLAIDILCCENIQFEVVGYTSNIYYLDDYNPQVVLSTIKVKHYVDKVNYIECDCGTPISILSRYCVEKGYKGYSGLVNLPGTVGAAVCNNSSCFNCSVSDHLIESTFYNLETKSIVILKPKDFEYNFRSSSLKTKRLNGVLLSIKLDKKQGCIQEEKSKAADATRIRKTTQEAPAYTLGSVYAGLTRKNDIVSRIANLGKRILKLVGAYNEQRYIKYLLFLYGYNDIKDFVSDKTINIFMWLPDRQDKHYKFLRYQAFIERVYKNPKLEIEIRNGNK